ncbi:hypothetical protein [Streptomyces sp. TRM68367]|uniref:hypothetical protein n=1 Tax=Streptomyces sp. TRM68367 TaxID=2758415 RepID=UPI00165BB5BA|nr:hypothetical protein [Streptomyces sp. TRM68367]MBC9729899.1 hypothetical protein [Streptomyces sp. TRM68367]
MGVWLLEALIDLAELVDNAVRTAHTWGPAAGVAGTLGVALGWHASGRFRPCPEADPDADPDVRTAVRTGADADHDTVTVPAPTCADTCPDWCGRTCPELSWRNREA